MHFCQYFQKRGVVQRRPLLCVVFYAITFVVVKCFLSSVISSAEILFVDTLKVLRWVIVKILFGNFSKRLLSRSNFLSFFKEEMVSGINLTL